jgi:DNA invertase Pin-like site-specific DNA recombinase
MNTIKAIRAGRIWKDAGAKVVRGPKIPPHLVPDVVRRADAGESQRDIAKSLGVSQGLVWKTISQARSAMPAERTRAS